MEKLIIKATPVIHPSLDWIANKVWGCKYEDCTADERKLIDLAKVNEHGNIDLSYQNLSRLRLFGANLRRANLREADLRRTDLRWVNLEEANLEGADLRRANLLGATIADDYTLTDRLPYYISNVGSENGTLELYNVCCASDFGSSWYVKRGCFSGSLPEFLAAVDKKHGDNEHGKRYRAIVAALCV